MFIARVHIPTCEIKRKRSICQLTLGCSTLHKPHFQYHSIVLHNLPSEMLKVRVKGSQGMEKWTDVLRLYVSMYSTITASSCTFWCSPYWAGKYALAYFLHTSAPLAILKENTTFASFSLSHVQYAMLEFILYYITLYYTVNDITRIPFLVTLTN